MDPQEKMQQLLAQLWEQHRQAIEERLDLIVSASDAIANGTISPAQREEAESAAHKLAGVLGTFGRSEGTDRARQIENWFADKENLATHASEIRQALTGLRQSIL